MKYKKGKFNDIYKLKFQVSYLLFGQYFNSREKKEEETILKTIYSLCQTEVEELKK